MVRCYYSLTHQLQHVHNFATSGTTVAAVSASLSAAYFLLSSSASSHQEEQNPHCMGIIETNLMDKIANKPYLNYHRVPAVVPTATRSAVVSTSKNRASAEANSGDSPSTTKMIRSHSSNTLHSTNRPLGVPQQMRILTIDVPQFRNVFDRECYVDMTMIYPDGVARPMRIMKRITSTEDRKGHTLVRASNDTNKTRNSKQQRSHTVETIEIVQKSLVKSLARCGDNGVVLLEASVKDMNPRNVQRRLSFPSSHNKGKEGLPTSTAAENSSSESSSTIYAEEIAGGHVDDESSGGYSEEIDAPWNQRAWAEELKLRISGGTTFDDPMQPSSSFSRFLFGNYYRRTVGQQGLWQWLYPARKHATDDEYHSPIASNKPHAVIADGEAMHRVPGSLRELVRYCRNADVPLYIINDPRIWGSNTHTDLPAAAAALRKTVKNRVVASALRIKEGSTFRRGQQLGRLEANVLHELQEQKNTAKRAIEEARKSFKKSKIEDWSQLSHKELERELMKRRVIIEKSKINETGENSTDTVLEYSKPFEGLCNECVAKQITAEKTISHPKDTKL